MDAAWTKEPEAVLEHLQVNKDNGLTTSQVLKKQAVYGKNGMSLR